MKATANIKTPAQYLASLPAERRVALTALHKAIRKAAPSLKPHIVYGMIGYGNVPDGPMLGLASQKQHISLYLGCGGYLPELSKQRLGKVSVGKSCVRFKQLADLDLKVAMELVRQAAKLAGK